MDSMSARRGRSALGMRSLPLAVLCLAGCATSPETTPVTPHRQIEGVEEVSAALTDLSAQCTFNATSHVVALTLNAGDLAVLARASDGNLTVNDIPCGAATAASTHQITVGEGSSGDQTLIIDYGNGLFAPGVSGAPGIVIDLGGQSVGDSLKVIGTPGPDNFVFGAAGLAINNDAFVDVTVAHVESLLVSLDDGDDTFSAAGNPATGAALAAAITVYGGAGNDTLRGGNGDDVLNGGAGNDTFTTGAVPDGNDAMNGGQGTDTADYSARTGAVTITIDDIADDGGTGETDNVATDIEIIKGGLGDDHLTGSPGADTIFGGPGNDVIAGGAGNDILNGDAGNDVFDEGSGANGSDAINGGAGIDTVSYASRTNDVTIALDAVAHSGELNENDKIALDVENAIGGAGDDTITGSTLDNVLDGGAGDDTISGGAGNDTLRGSTGNDTLNGDAGDDTFDEGAAANGADTMTGGSGIDRVSYAARNNDLVIVMNGATGSGEASEGDLIGVDIENLVGGAGADSITGNAGDNQLEGGAGTAVDALFGLGGDDVLDGGGGADTVDCGGGDADINLDPSTASVAGCEL
jgi:Ca2+-binding RTX toxin-like protein